MKLKQGDYVNIEGETREKVEAARFAFHGAGFPLCLNGESASNHDYLHVGIDENAEVSYWDPVELFGSDSRLLTIDQVIGTLGDTAGQAPEDAQAEDEAFKAIEDRQKASVSKQGEYISETFHTLSDAERDPSGISQHEAGSKLDAGKNRLGLVLGGFSNALQAVGEVGTFGANKYTDNGWKEVPDGKDRYSDALLRHYFKEQSGELKDVDSKLLHAAHLAWNALSRLELIISESD